MDRRRNKIAINHSKQTSLKNGTRLVSITGKQTGDAGGDNRAEQQTE